MAHILERLLAERLNVCLTDTVGAKVFAETEARDEFSDEIDGGNRY